MAETARIKKVDIGVTTIYKGQRMSASNPNLITKTDVAQRLGVSTRTVEKLVAACKFPPPLKLGKSAMWAADVVERWLERALLPQQTWEPPKRRSRVNAA
jgi:predicted DNA-binding transcriptional regulator AlpA